jgi:glycosyltransferase involved in cell wall biosynthesis
MGKYQFYISFNDKLHTASSKAINDCTRILVQQGYKDYNLNIKAPGRSYIGSILLQVFKLIFSIEAGSTVAIQYPLLSGNKAFKYIMSVLRLKKVKFFCIVHDLDDLRYGLQDDSNRHNEIEILNCYDAIVVHNDVMKDWLNSKGIKAPMVSLTIFDYLTEFRTKPVERRSPNHLRSIVFAGNLSKSGFLYQLGALASWHFNAYGPNYQREKGSTVDNVAWRGSCSPEEILLNMDGAFGLIWDGKHIDQLDDMFGNYLRYNNPHKLSLYLAAGLPVIAPRQSAIASLIERHNIGILVDSLFELKDLKITTAEYLFYEQNVRKLSDRIKTGYYLTQAIIEAECALFSPKRQKTT